MIVHVVLFAPRAGLAPGEEDAMVAALERAVREIPTLRRARFGRRVAHGQAYDALAPGEYPYVGLLEFDDLAGLQAYLAHPAHQALGATFHDTLRAAIAFDYEVGAVAEIRGWLGGARAGRAANDVTES